MKSSIALAAAAGALIASASPVAKRQQVCNGNAAFCDRSYSNVSFIGAHDSGFVGSIADPRVNQEEDITDQLNAGIRFVEAQTHLSGSTIELCHTSCAELDAGALQDYLSSINSWLEANPNDVVTLLLTNGDSIPITQYDSVFEASGLKQFTFVPSTNPLPIDQWPTFSDLISAGTRLIAFMDYHADITQVPYILDEFTYFFETPYDTTDPNFAECTLDRPAGASPDGLMYIVNHFLDTNVFGSGVLIPDNADDYTTNAATGTGSIGAQADLCTSTYGRVPNIVLVDMFDRGDVFTAQNTLNGV